MSPAEPCRTYQGIEPLSNGMVRLRVPSRASTRSMRAIVVSYSDVNNIVGIGVPNVTKR